MGTRSLQEIANELPLLRYTEDREKLLGVVGALVLRRISLSKASEIMGMHKETFLGLLQALGVEYSYLNQEDVEVERTW
jgi:predicted HTH domain antitoxin